MNRVICIVGPTGVGKTKLSIEIAKKYNGEIINGDSVQVYKGLDIGSAKVKKEEMEGITHHLIDFLEPTDSYSIADFQKQARIKIQEITNRGKLPIIVGGSGLYIKAALYDYNFSAKSRNRLNLSKYDSLTNTELYELLKSIDQNIAKKMHPNNRKRVLRGIELANSNIENNELQKGNNLLYDSLIICLTQKRELLYDIINKRVDRMINDNLLDEVKALYNNNVYSQSTRAIGYKEIYMYLSNELSLDEAIELVKRNSRRFAKRQLTWFKNQMNCLWINVDINNFTNTITNVLSIIDKEKDK